MTDETMIPTLETDAILPEETEAIPVEEDTQSEAIRAAYEAGRSDALMESNARITELEKALRQANLAAKRRETEIRCGEFLRERGLDAALSPFILAPQETEVEEEILLHRVEALRGAVDAAALRELQSRAISTRPQGEKTAPLTGDVIRDTPIARLAEMMG